MNYKNNVQIDDILGSLSGMNKSDLQKIADYMFDILNENNRDTSVNALCESTDPSVCKKCGAVHVVKRGKNYKGHQKYWCKECGAIFTASSYTVFSCTHKDADTWKNFILYTLEGHSLRYCAEHCNISLPTSFMWRHKIMDALTEKQFSSKLNGLVEIDELFVKVSYKGNHTKSKTFTMPRKSYKRGSDNRARSFSEKVCVLTAVERSTGFSGIATHRGLLNLEVLSAHLDGRISDEAIVLSDESSVLKKYFGEHDYEHIALSSSQTGSYIKTAPVTKGPYHINNVNSLHSRFRLFLRRYNGVASKYLNSYIALFIWFENSHAKYNDQVNDTVEFLSSCKNNTRYSNVRAKMLPAV